MKKYLLFIGDAYYPQGGWYDFHSSHESVEDAARCAANENCDWWHVVDIDTGKAVDGGVRNYK